MKPKKRRPGGDRHQTLWAAYFKLTGTKKTLEKMDGPKLRCILCR